MSILAEIADRLDRKKFGFSSICESAGNQLESDSKANASWTDQTGNARQTIHSTVSGGGLNFNINVSHGVDYGGILEEGSSAHIIKVKNKKALSDGSTIFGKSVKHPGTSPYNGIKTTMESEVPTIAQQLAEYWSDL